MNPARTLRAYRATGADLPFGDPRRAHGVAMEGYYWRFSDPRSGRVVVALCGVTQRSAGAWATVALAGHPGGFVRSADLRAAGADPASLGVWAGERPAPAGARGGGWFDGSADRVRVGLGDDAWLDVRVEAPRVWPRRVFGGLGPAHAVPGLGQYWSPHLLGGVARGNAVLGGERVELDGWEVYAEKNWGAGGFPRHWWWGQAHGFPEDSSACVAFAGGEALRLGPAGVAASALVVSFGGRVVRLGTPGVSPVRAEVGVGWWRLRGRSLRWAVELEGHAAPAEAHLLPIPLVEPGHSVPGALQNLGGTLGVTVRERGRVVFEGASALAGLEAGGLARVRDAAARRGE